MIQLIISCILSLSVTSAPVKPPKHIKIHQNGSEIIIKEASSTIELKRQPFSIRLYNKAYNSEKERFYSAQIAAFQSRELFDQIETGKKLQDISCFAPGTGMAVGKNKQYDWLIFSDDAHAYTFYENENSKRLRLIDVSGKYLELEYDVKGPAHSGHKIPMEETSVADIYVAVITDRNLNGKIDRHELKKVHIRFE